MKQQNNHEFYNDLSPQEQELVELLRNAHFVPSSQYQQDLWHNLQQLQLEEQRERSLNKMSSSQSLFKLFGPFLKIGATAAVSSVFTAILLVGAIFVFSPSARAQVSNIIIRFVEVDSPPAVFETAQTQNQPASDDSALVAVMTEEPNIASTMETEQAVSPKNSAAAPDSAPQQAETPVLSEAAEESVAPSALNSAQASESKSEEEPALPGGGVPPPPEFDRSQLNQNGFVPNPTLLSIEEAQSQTDFAIRVPTWLPEGYTLQGVTVPPDFAANLPQSSQSADAPALPTMEAVTLHYRSQTNETFMLSQSLISRSPLPGFPAETQLPVPKGSVQEVSINGQAGQYVEIALGQGTLRQLHWQDTATGLNYDLMGPSLDQATMMRIAESLQ